MERYSIQEPVDEGYPGDAALIAGWQAFTADWAAGVWNWAALWGIAGQQARRWCQDVARLEPGSKTYALAVDAWGAAFTDGVIAAAQTVAELSGDSKLDAEARRAALTPRW